MTTTRKAGRSGPGPARARVRLSLYIAGNASRSTRAIENARRLCDAWLQDAFDLRVIDVYQQPELARAAHVVAVPVLVKDAPPPPRQVIGDLADGDAVARDLGLDLRAAAPGR